MRKSAYALAAGGVLAVSAQVFAEEASWADWMERTEISVDVTRGEKPTWSIETVQPLMQDAEQQNTVFTQLRAARANRFGESRHTFNIGAGYRKLFAENTVLGGINAFYDIETKHSLKRWGLGAELRWSAFDVYLNKYYGLTGWKTTNLGAEEKPLDGYDADLSSQVPYMPWARFHVIHYKWNKERAVEDLTGNKLSLEALLTPNLNLEVGRNFNTNNIAEDSNYLMLRWRLDGSGSKQPSAMNGLVTTKAFEMRDMREHTLDRVRRNNTLVVERSTGGIVIARGN